MGRLNNKIAVITGAASGIGKATAKLFIKEGASVIFGDIQDELGETLAKELGPNASYLHTNVQKEADIKALINLAVENYGRLDIMYNNAGFGGVGGMIEEIPTDAFDVTMEVMFRSVFLGMKHAAPIMKKQKSGSIISTASVAGLRTGMGPHIYSSAKAAIIHLTRCVAMELGEFNIRVNCVCPGGIATAIFGRGIGLPQDKAERLAELAKVFLCNLQPIKRAGLPEDVATAVLWLASDDSTFVNGHALVVDGGFIGGRLWQEDTENFETFAKKLGIDDIQAQRRKINEEIAKYKYNFE
jgi:NAD(P)-dependent dehydrogenase (short-subunit alcohol dehydrogenase family)